MVYCRYTNNMIHENFKNCKAIIEITTYGIRKNSVETL